MSDYESVLLRLKICLEFIHLVFFFSLFLPLLRPVPVGSILEYSESSTWNFSFIALSTQVEL